MKPIIRFNPLALTGSALLLLLSACGGGGGAGSAPAAGGGTTMPSPITVSGTDISWSADHLTRTVTTRYSDGTASATSAVVAPVAAGALMGTQNGINKTSPLTSTYGDGYVETVQDGSVIKPFAQTLLATKGNTDPNAVVATGTATIDLRWGTRPAPFVLSTTDSVVAGMTTSRLDYSFVRNDGVVVKWGLPVNFSNAAPLDMSSASLQNLWITSDVQRAWAQGWTGAGVKIGVIDDFVINDRSEISALPLATGCSQLNVNGAALTTCGKDYKAYIGIAHGNQVSAIAGGALSALSGALVETGDYFSTATGARAGSYTAGAGLTITFSSPMYGVAKDAQVLRTDFINHQSNADGLFAQLRDWGAGTDATSQRYRSLQVVNLSLGGTSTNPVVNKQAYAAQLAYANTATVPDAVFVKAAGNGTCVVSQTNCDSLNPVFVTAASFKDKTLLVGALDAAGGSLAGYSNKAGNYSARFLVADGRGLMKLDGSYDQGTSFAAPRVSGYAAIVRQKFSNLSAAQTASVLLDTAAWLTVWGEKTAATQAIYGQGEANLGRALAPVGALR